MWSKVAECIRHRCQYSGTVTVRAAALADTDPAPVG
jgi:hypothetical protein